MGAGTRRVREWSTKIWSKASQIRGFLLPFIFATSTCLIHFDRERPNRLRHAIILGGSFPINTCGHHATSNNEHHEPPTHLGFCLLRRYYAAKATSSHSSTCICDRESRSVKPSYSVILHQERVNKVIRK
jgi:hypothetical protein